MNQIPASLRLSESVVARVQEPAPDALN